MSALGELSLVLKREMLPYADQLLPIIIANMLDSTSYKKQEVAVRTLGRLF